MVLPRRELPQRRRTPEEAEQDTKFLLENLTSFATATGEISDTEADDEMLQEQLREAYAATHRTALDDLDL